MKTIILIVFLVICASLASPSSAQPGEPWQLVAEVNALRASYGLQPLLLPRKRPRLHLQRHPTITATVSGPFIHQVLEGESCYGIALKYKMDLLLLITTNNLTPDCIIKPGDQLVIPGPDAALPSATPIPENLPRGTKIQYVVVGGDSLGALAIKFNTTVVAILKENPTIKNDKDIKVGQALVIPVNLVPTNTPAPPTATLAPATPTKVIGTPVNVTPTFTATPRSL